MSVQSRLILLSTLMIAVLIMPAYYGLRQLMELREIALDLRVRQGPALVAVGGLQANLTDLDRHVPRYLADPDSTTRGEVIVLLEQAATSVERLGESGYQTGAEELGESLDAVTGSTLRADSLILAGELTAARAYFAEARANLRAAADQVAGLIETIDAQGAAAAVRAQEISAGAVRITSVGTGIAVGFGLSLAVISILTLVAPLRRLRSAMAAVAAGRFVPPRTLPYNRPDEIGDLSRSFRSMTERLAELDKIKAEFVGIASHELKTPVNVIRGYAEIMEDGFYGPLTERQESILDQMREQTDLLSERVNQLLSVSRMEARGLEMRMSEIATRDLIEAVKRAFDPVASRHEIDFRVESHASAPERLVIDASRVQNELFGNLLANAFKFTPVGGQVRLRVRGENGRVVFELRDTGEGIPESELPYIFEKYYQAGHHAGKVGAGLGLAIAREVVEAHAGTIRARSEPGRGTEFFVELPVLAGGGHAAPVHPLEPPPAENRGEDPPG
jgi:signal transduction histidine kinase